MSSNPVYAFFATPKSFGPFVLRMLLSAVFLVHGGQKAFGWFGGAGWTETIGMWSSPEGLGIPAGFAAAAMIGEIMIAISMFFGILTRLSALGVIVIMTGAIVLVHSGGSIAESEYPFALLLVALSLLFLGGGRLSMDRGISSQLLPIIG